MKKMLFTALFILFVSFLIIITGCIPVPPAQEPVVRNDLIMVNFGLSSRYSTSAYVFFFENNPTAEALPRDTQVKFDESIEKPVVRINRIDKPDGYTPLLNGVTVFFRDREQMKEYWMVK